MMPLTTIARDKYETYYVQMVCTNRPEERARRENWQGSEHVFVLETKQHTDEIAEMEKWLASNNICHYMCHSQIYTFIEIPREADATMFWIRFKA
jgi:hypothetical protein